MRIILVANAPWMQSAYSDQMYSLARRLVDDGHKVWWMPNCGFYGGAIEYKGIEILPSETADSDGNDIIGYHVMATGADIVMTLADVFEMPKYGGSDFRWIAYLPVDKTKVDQHTAAYLKRAWRIWTPSQYGVERLAEAGLFARHIPHGVEKEFIEPIPDDGVKFFKHMHGIDEDAYLVGSVGMNAYYPGRKGMERLMAAFKQFTLNHSDDKMTLYLHTNPKGERGALDLSMLAREHFDLSLDQLRFPDPYNYHLGYPKRTLAAMYKALDIYVQPTGGEGFGVPVIEAQAQGTLVIASDNSCMREIIFDGAGTFVPMSDWYFATPSGGKYGLVSIEGLTEALEEAYAPNPKFAGERISDMTELQQVAQMKVGPLHWDRLWHSHWKPFFADVEAEIEAQKATHTLDIPLGKRANALEDRGDTVRKHDTGQEHRDERAMNAIVKSWGPQRGIVPILEEGTDEFGRYWFDTPKMTPLSDVTDFTSEQADAILEDVRAGAEYMNAQGYAHRDLCPKNVLWDGEKGYIFDFDWMEKMPTPEIATQVDFEPWDAEPELLVPSVRAGLTTRGFHRVAMHLLSVNLMESDATSQRGVPYQAVAGVGERNCQERWDTLAPDVKGKRVLDLGCNLGWFTAKAHAEGAKSVLGVDADQPILDAAAILHPECNGAWKQMDLDEEMPTGKFDVAFCLAVWQHLAAGKERLVELLKTIPVVYWEGKNPSMKELGEMGFQVERRGFSERGRNLFKLTSKEEADGNSGHAGRGKEAMTR